jgi:uncharacterized protein YjbI with pentapeptide repeats
MANPDHLAMLLDDGVEQWNSWRRDHPGIVPNLFKADLINANLAGGGGGVNLYRANLESANLLGTNLQGANLRDANLDGASVGFTVFGNANLTVQGVLSTANT